MEQTERNESKGTNRRLIRMAALVPSVPEIRYLLARTPHLPTDTKALHHRLVAGDDDIRPQPRSHTTNGVYMRNCSTNHL